ncbi:MAG: hypothetical protein ACKVRN_03945 [Pyrinomonadaceae bacterium]
MKSNKIIWVLVALLVATTIAITFDAQDVISQDQSTISPKGTPPPDRPDFSKYGIANYESVESLEASELEKRKRTSKRYDNEGWVVKFPHHDTGKIGRVKEEEPPPIIPVEESDLIVSGKAVSVKSYLSNDKSSVYSEFTIKINQILKNSVTAELKAEDKIIIDRAGGVVRYPNGQEVLYLDSDDGLPEAGREYVLFLQADKESENYKVVTLYEVQENRTLPLDSGRNVDDIKRMGKHDFLRTVRQRLSGQLLKTH